MYLYLMHSACVSSDWPENRAIVADHHFALCARYIPIASRPNFRQSDVPGSLLSFLPPPLHSADSRHAEVLAAQFQFRRGIRSKSAHTGAFRDAFRSCARSSVTRISVSAGREGGGEEEEGRAEGKTGVIAASNTCAGNANVRVKLAPAETRRITLDRAEADSASKNPLLRSPPRRCIGTFGTVFLPLGYEVTKFASLSP